MMKPEQNAMRVARSRSAVEAAIARSKRDKFTLWDQVFTIEIAEDRGEQICELAACLPLSCDTEPAAG